MGNLIAQPAKKKVARPAQDEFDRYTEAFVYDKKFEWGSKKAARHVQRKAKTVIAKRKIAHPIPPPPKISEKPVSKTTRQRAKRQKPDARIEVPAMDDQTAEEKAEKIPPSSELNERIEKAMERTDKIQKALPPKKERLLFQPVLIEPLHKRLLYMNPGDEKIQMAVYSIVNGFELPKWAVAYRKRLSVKKGVLHFDITAGKSLPFAFSDQKRQTVKRLYYDPKKPATIHPITDEIRKKYCNVTTRNVTKILRTFETYQRNFRRRRPPKVLGRMNLTAPGILAIDMFFPSKLLGWRKMNCLACMDTWSRFCRVYALPKKDFASVEAALTLFVQEFVALGHLPRRCLADKGTDLSAAKKVMEKFRLARDKGPMVLHSQTGTPINIIEAMNAQIQRRMQIFRTARITDDPSVLLEDIANQINTQRRPDRGNLTPLELLQLTPGERQQVNEIYTPYVHS